MPQAAGEQNHPFWDEVVKKFFVLPGASPLDASHSLVLTLSEESDYYPVNDEITIPIPQQLACICLYILFWAVLFYGTGSWETVSSYATGFLIGLSFNFVALFFWLTPTQIFLTEYPRHPYVLTTPVIENVEKGTYLKNPNDYIHWAQGAGDYKIIIGNTDKPDPDHIGYIYTADTYLKKLAAGDFQAMNLMDYLEGGSRTVRSDIDDARFNAGNQSGLHYFSERSKSIAWVAYCMGIIVITWAMYITNSKWGSQRQLTLNIITIAVCIIAGASVIDEYTVVEYNYGVFIKERLLILAISLGITSILAA